MRYLMRERILSWGDDFRIKNAEGTSRRKETFSRTNTRSSAPAATSLA
jgi:uncharacterized protein YxjI